MALDRALLPVFDLGIAPYAPVQTLQNRIQEAVIGRRIPGVLLLLEHEPVITLGSRGQDDDLRLPRSAVQNRLPVERSERGGQATLHAPGQLIAYPIVPIPGRDLRAYVHGLEETVIVLLREYGVAASRHQGRPGVYVGDMKISSVGLRCRRWVATHGISLNVDVDLGFFDLIVSCGDPDMRQTSLQSLLGEPQSMSLIKERYVRVAAQVFGWEAAPVKMLGYEEVEAALAAERLSL